jgi:hypothetical protein
MVDLFRNEEDGDVALNELSDVLIRTGTPEVVEEVERSH